MATAKQKTVIKLVKSGSLGIPSTGYLLSDTNRRVLIKCMLFSALFGSRDASANPEYKKIGNHYKGTVDRNIRFRPISPQLSEYDYASSDLPDPFIPPLPSVPSLSRTKPKNFPIVSVLQNYPLSELNVVGIWTLENNKKRALITTIEDEGIVVSSGDYVGNSGGKVVAIATDHLVIREFSIFPDGTRKFKDQKMWIGEKNNLNSLE